MSQWSRTLSRWCRAPCWCASRLGKVPQRWLQCPDRSASASAKRKSTGGPVRHRRQRLLERHVVPRRCRRPKGSVPPVRPSLCTAKRPPAGGGADPARARAPGFRFPAVGQRRGSRIRPAAGNGSLALPLLPVIHPQPQELSLAALPLPGRARRRRDALAASVARVANPEIVSPRRICCFSRCFLLCHPALWLRCVRAGKVWLGTESGAARAGMHAPLASEINNW